jgi:hypothetical protein
MDIRIGIVQSMKELELDLPDTDTAETVKAQFDAAVKHDDVWWLTDRKGRSVGIPAARIAYVEMAKKVERSVGFGV